MNKNEFKCDTEKVIHPNMSPNENIFKRCAWEMTLLQLRD